MEGVIKLGRQVRYSVHELHDYFKPSHFSTIIPSGSPSARTT